MATPHVSGFAALLRQQGITAPAAIEAAMKRFATDRGPAGRDNEYGDGLDQSAGDTARPGAGAMTAAGRLMSDAALLALAALPQDAVPRRHPSH